MDLNHRPHAYQACALDQLSYRPIWRLYLIPTLAMIFQRTGGGRTALLGPWKLNSKRYARCEPRPVREHHPGLSTEVLT